MFTMKTPKKKSVPPQFTETFTVTVPLRLAIEIRTCAGFWDRGDVEAWLVKTIETACQGDIDGLLHEMAEKCQPKTGGNLPPVKARKAKAKP